MAWERRKRGGRYYTTSKRVNGKIVKEYHGTGMVAEAIASVDAYLREQKHFQQLMDRFQREDILGLESTIKCYISLVNAAMTGILEAAGYHRHHRGEWRKARMSKSQSLVVVKPFDEWTHEEKQHIIGQAQRGDKKALVTARAMLKACPGFATALGDMAWQLRGQLVEMETGDNPLIKDIWRDQATAMQKELEGDTRTPLEHMLCEQVVTCWLDVQMSDMRGANIQISMPWREFYQNRAARAHTRFLAACETLARVRRLQIPVMQVNVAQPGAQQINLATNAPAIS